MAKREISKKDEDYHLSHRLVGRFFQTWALLELGINHAISKILNLEAPSDAIILANVQVRDKIHILRTAFRNLPEADRACANKLVNRIAKMAQRRNLLAHCIFYPMQDGSLEFARVEAKGSFEYVNTYWDQKNFAHFYQVMDSTRENLEVVARKAANNEKIIRALMRNPTSQPTYQTSASTGLLGEIFGLGRQTQSLPDSGEATPQKDSQTPPAPQPKDGEAK